MGARPAINPSASRACEAGAALPASRAPPEKISRPTSSACACRHPAVQMSPAGHALRPAHWSSSGPRDLTVISLLAAASDASVPGKRKATCR